MILYLIKLPTYVIKKHMI